MITTATDEPYYPGRRDASFGYHPPARISQEFGVWPNQRATLPYTLNKYRRRDWHLNIGRGSIIFNIQESVKHKTGTGEFRLANVFQDPLCTMLNLQQMNFALATLSLRPQGFLVSDFFKKYNVVGITASEDEINRGRDPASDPDVSVTVRGQVTQVPNVWGDHVRSGMGLYLEIKRIPFTKKLQYRTSETGELQAFHMSETTRRSVVQAVPYAGWSAPDPEQMYYEAEQNEVFGSRQDAPKYSSGRYIRIGACQHNYHFGEKRDTFFNAYSDMSVWAGLPMISVYVDPVRSIMT